MKPQQLTICGWGPYKDETVIDFTKLNTELFLITGQTGAGKTTIFDAIAYALYGMMSGEVREKGSVRSDFADENTKTYVELHMTHRGLQYHIIRNPEYLRPKKKKGGESAFTKEKENAALTLPDGSIIAGNQEVTAKIEEILGLDGKQFRQISMIAQGEFARMLLASPAEKTAIFRELFGTGIYAAVQNGLKERSVGLYREYMNYRHKLEEDIALLTIEDETWEQLIAHEQPDFAAVERYLAECFGGLEKRIRECSDEEKRLQKELLEHKEELAKAEEINRRFDELEKSKALLDELKSKEDLMQKQKGHIAVLQEAKLLMLEEKAILQSKQAAEDEQGRLLQLEASHKQCLQKVEELEEIQVKKDAIRKAYALKEQVANNRSALCEISQRILKAQKLLEKAQEEYGMADGIFEDAKKSYEKADKLYKNAVIGIAAQYVKEGEPCPVCGSLHHPDVAKIAKEVPDEKELERLKEKMETARTTSVKLYEKALNYKNEEKRLQKEEEELHIRQEDLQQKEEAVAKDIADYVSGVTQEVFENGLMQYLTNRSKAEEIRKQADIAAKEYKRKQDAYLVAGDAFEEKIKDAGFAGDEDYRKTLDNLPRLEQLEKETGAYYEKLLATKEVYGHLKEALRGKKRRQTQQMQEEFSKKQEELERIRHTIQNEISQARQIARSLDGIGKNRAKAEAIKEEYGIVKDLDEMANGNNARRLVFEQFVLAGYFEQILRAANVRLSDMSNGRYELIRSKQVSDGRKKDNLEILVMDYYTGKERSVKTLSGGESFKASLALALGMSDCIQARSGGIGVETLFIDEGFGALDEESLEQSCMVLQTLAGTDRMIGIISHVSQLRERIDSQIIIEKKNYGSSVRVRA